MLGLETTSIRRDSVSGSSCHAHCALPDVGSSTVLPENLVAAASAAGVTGVGPPPRIFCLVLTLRFRSSATCVMTMITAIISSREFSRHHHSPLSDLLPQDLCPSSHQVPCQVLEGLIVNATPNAASNQILGLFVSSVGTDPPILFLLHTSCANDCMLRWCTPHWAP
jgi:hypothetical protein